MRTWFFSLGLALALAAPAAADRAAEDDLAAVRKAVRGSATQSAAPAPAEAAPATPQVEREKRAVEDETEARPARARRGGEPRWLRVRIHERGGKRGRVSLNLPLGLVRAFGEDWPIRGCRRCEDRRGPTLGEVLRSLDSGENLVEIEDDQATVRVWVD